MEPREDPDSSVNLQEAERRYDELEKRLIGKHEAATHEESKILERWHTMTTTAATHEESEILVRQHTTTTVAGTDDEAEILEQHTMTTTAAAKDVTTAAITNEETEILEQPTAVTAARKEETSDSKDQELSALIERPKNMDRKRQGSGERHQQEDQTGNQRQHKRSKKREKYMIFLKNSKE